MSNKFGFKQEDEFAERLMPRAHRPLSDAVEWIEANLEPEEVFSKDKLFRWAGRNGLVEEE